jgi:hypothetical protein
VGQQSLLGLPGVLGQVPEQGQAYPRIEVLLGEDPADELLQLKLQKPRPVLPGPARLVEPGPPLPAERSVADGQPLGGVRNEASSRVLPPAPQGRPLGLPRRRRRRSSRRPPNTPPLACPDWTADCHGFVMNSLWTIGPLWGFRTLCSGGPSKVVCPEGQAF